MSLWTLLVEEKTKGIAGGICERELARGNTLTPAVTELDQLQSTSNVPWFTAEGGALVRINWDDPQARELADRIVEAACETAKMITAANARGQFFAGPTVDDLARSILDAQAVGVLKR